MTIYDDCNNCVNLYRCTKGIFFTPVHLMNATYSLTRYTIFVYQIFLFKIMAVAWWSRQFSDIFRIVDMLAETSRNVVWQSGDWRVAGSTTFAVTCIYIARRSNDFVLFGAKWLCNFWVNRIHNIISAEPKLKWICQIDLQEGLK